MTCVTVKDIYDVIDDFAPFVFQEDYDNSGLQIGDLSCEVKRILLALDVNLEAVSYAVEWGIDLIVSHHPLFFRPLRQIDLSNRLLKELLNHNINVISAHTSLDVVPSGVSFQLAERLGLKEVKILSPKKVSHFYKLVFFLPTGYERAILDRLFDKGVGEYLFYEGCAFEGIGEGRFKEKEGAKPFLQSANIYKEAKIELIVRADKLYGTINRLKELHPYQEVAYDVFPEAINPIEIGYGCIGVLPSVLKLSQLINLCKEQLGIKNVRYVGDLNKKIKCVALCGGSGGSLIGEAVKNRADVYISGDLKYHEVLDNKDKIALLDVGHRASELPVLKKLEAVIKGKFKDLSIYYFVENNDFFGYY